MSEFFVYEESQGLIMYPSVLDRLWLVEQRPFEHTNLSTWFADSWPKGTDVMLHGGLELTPAVIRRAMRKGRVRW